MLSLHAGGLMPDKPHLLAMAALPEFLDAPLRERFTCHELPAQGEREAFLRERREREGQQGNDGKCC